MSRSRRTVLVLGAGSSADFNLPTGPALATKISKSIAFRFEEFGRQQAGRQVIWEALRKAHPESGPTLFASAHKVARGLPLSRSIDDLLYNHGDDPLAIEVGKAGIVEEILRAERQSSIIELSAYNVAERDACMLKKSDTWIFKLFKFLQTGVRRTEVGTIFHNISIINFNYDRCVEHFLFHALQMSYSISPEVAAEVMATLDITHPYGDVGDLPWEVGRKHEFEFGASLRHDQVMPAISRIKTFTEQNHDDDERAHWQDILHSARSIIFLGFAFHRQNMDLLRVGTEFRANRPFVAATSYLTSDADKSVFTSRLNGSLPGAFFHSEPKYKDMKCGEFMDDMGLRIFDF